MAEAQVNTETTQAPAPAAAAPEPVRTSETEVPAAQAAEETVPKRAMLNEQRRRQEERRRADEAAREAAYWKGVAEARASGTAAPEPPAGVDIDEAKFWKDPRETLATVQKRAKEEAKAELKNELRAEAWNDMIDRAARTEPKAIKKYGDEKVSDHIAAFRAQAGDPRTSKLWARAMRAEDPTEFAYQFIEEQRAGDANERRIAELEAELASVKKQKTAGTVEKPTMPASNAGARGSGPALAPVKETARSGSELLGRMFAGRD